MKSPRSSWIFFYSLLCGLSVPLLEAGVLSQPSFTPDTTPQLPMCDYSVVKGAQNKLDELIYDFKQKSENRDVWRVKIGLEEHFLIYDASVYYNCDLKNQLQKPVETFGY